MYMAEYKLVGTAQLLRLTKPGMDQGTVSADLAFARFTTAVACRENGIHFTGLVKTATSMHPKKYIDEVDFQELGDDITLTSSVEGHNIMAHAWGDKVRKYFESTHSTTHPGNLTSGDGERYMMKMGMKLDSLKCTTKQSSGRKL